MVSLKVMSYIIGASLRDVRLAVASTDALTCGSAAREATGCKRTRSDPARPHVPGGMGRVPQGIATPLIAATRRLRMHPARQASARGGERDLHLEAGPAPAIRPSPTQRPASRIGYRRSARSSPQVADAPIHLLCTGSAVIIRWSQPPRSAGRRAVIWLLAGPSAVPVWPIGLSPVLYIYTSPSLGRMSASAALRYVPGPSDSG
jgi:hypothetical protein